MTDPRRQRYAPYLRRLADLMGLRDWTLTLLDSDPGGDANAKMDTTYGRKRAEIELSDHFLGQPPEDQRQTLVHELVHVHFAAMHHFLCHELGESSAFEAYQLAHEYGVDAIAEEWARTLPLPDAVRPRGGPGRPGRAERPVNDATDDAIDRCRRRAGARLGAAIVLGLFVVMAWLTWRACR